MLSQNWELEESVKDVFVHIYSSCLHDFVQRHGVSVIFN